jgi:hypothetical protein
MSSLLDFLTAQITPDLVGGLASNLGESRSAIEKALRGAVAMLATLARKAQDTAFLSQIMSLVSHFATRGANAVGAAAGASSTVGGSTVSGVLQVSST